MLWAALLLQVAPPVDASVDWLADGALTLGASVGWFALHQAQPDLVDPRCPCEPGQVNGFDRSAVDNDYQAGERLADVSAGAAILGPLAALAAVSPEHYAEDALLIVQSAAFAGVLTSGVKALAGRPYPYMYGPAPYPEQNGDGVNYASFWSGHTAVPMAAAVSFAVIVSERKPRWQWWAWTVGPALALGAGALQMSAGNHFATDVLAGGAAGAGVGWLNTALRF